MMKKILLITTILLTLGFFIPKPIFAFDTCTGTTCDTGLGDDLVLQALAVDDEDNILTVGYIDYVWEILDPALGIFTSSNGASCTHISNGGLKCIETNNTSKSTANLKASSASAVVDGRIKVTGTYGFVTIEKDIKVSTSCKRQPNLYYGIASVRINGTSSWQSSTAEVLETCKNEYKLFEGIGQGN